MTARELRRFGAALLGGLSLILLALAVAGCDMRVEFVKEPCAPASAMTNDEIAAIRDRGLVR